MSILNHFGKVKASYKKYESVLPEYKGYMFINRHYFLAGEISSQGIIGGGIENIKKLNLSTEEIPLYRGYNDILLLSPSQKISTTYVHHNLNTLFSFTNLVETFSKCLEKVKDKLSSELWKNIECCPFINIIDLLILKQDDTDKHIEHFEEIIKLLIDNNKLLQTKINSLESKMNLFKTKIPVAVAISKCGEKTVGEEILCE